MNDNKSNASENDVIIYHTLTGLVMLTRSDFDSDEVFAKWKEWLAVHEGTPRRMKHTSLWANLDYVSSVVAEDEAMRIVSADVLPFVKHCTSEKQHRRLLMYEGEGYTLEEISKIEGCSINAVWKSIIGAKKRITKIWNKQFVK